MRTINIEELHKLNAGMDCGSGWGWVAGLAIGFTAVAIATGGAALPVLIAAEAAIVGSPVAAINCITK